MRRVHDALHAALQRGVVCDALEKVEAHHGQAGHLVHVRRALHSKAAGRALRFRL
jgi:hypothetical protein